MSMDTISLWKAITEQTVEFSSLKEDIEVDVAIVGGGITGLTAAYQLVNHQQTVAILEKDNIGQGTTGFSTGNLYIAVQSYFHAIERRFGAAVVEDVLSSRREAIDFIENLILTNNIKCNFQRRPWFLFTNSQEKIRQLETEKKLMSLACHVEEVSNKELPWPCKKAIKIDHQARLNPYEYCLQLARILKNKKCLLYENTQAIEYKEMKDKCVIFTAKNKVIAKKVFIATHVPFGIHKTQKFVSPYRSYVIAAKIKDGIYPDGNYWDLEDPHHVISTHSTNQDNIIDIIAIAGCHHKTGQAKMAKDNFIRLENFLGRIFSLSSIEYRWSAQHYQPADMLPYIGLTTGSSRNIYIATGFFADGLTYGTLAGLIVSDLILGNHNHYSSIYDSNRHTPIAKAPAYLKENANVLIQYMKDFPAFDNIKSIEQLKKGCGKVVDLKGEKVAAYRDPDGKLHCVSAVCTHMKCIVDWNNAERTWDCPCHGSRFSHDGKVLEGPAILPLKPIDVA